MPRKPKTETKLVTFLDPVTVTDENNNPVFSAKMGEEIELPAPSAERWIRRGKAVAGKIKPKTQAADEGEQADQGTQEPAGDEIEASA